MGHCYADRDQFWQYIADSGADQWREDDSFVLTFLDSASRSVDEYCRRTGSGHPMSGFGPRVGVNTYDGRLSSPERLDLDDDLLTLTSLEVADVTAGTFATWTTPSDYLLLPYDRTPKRTVIVPDTSAKRFGLGYATTKATGTWGYADTRAALAAKVATGGWTDSATDVAFDDATEIAMGQTLWCGTEMVYVKSLSATGAVVERGAHGSPAATHAAGASLQVQTYDSDVRIATLQLALRRWKHRQAGLSGDYGGVGGLPIVTDKTAEDAILRALVWHLSFRGRG